MNARADEPRCVPAFCREAHRATVKAYITDLKAHDEVRDEREPRQYRSRRPPPSGGARGRGAAAPDHDSVFELSLAVERQGLDMITMRRSPVSVERLAEFVTGQ